MTVALRTGKLDPGTLRRLVLDRLGARRDDVVVHAGLGKDAAMEGTAILATDLAGHLEGRVAPELIARARGLTARLSVVRDGVQAAEHGATALHDPTEGGVLGALWEMAEAAGT